MVTSGFLLKVMIFIVLMSIRLSPSLSATETFEIVTGSVPQKSDNRNLIFVPEKGIYKGYLSDRFLA